MLDESATRCVMRQLNGDRFTHRLITRRPPIDNALLNYTCKTVQLV